MKAKISSVLSSLRSSSKLKKALIICLIILVGLYVFSIPTFATGNLFNHSNYICYALVGILSLVTVFSTLLYSSFKVRPVLFLIPAFVLFTLIGTLAYSHEYRSWLTLVLMAAVLFILFYAFRIIANKEIILLTIILAFTLFATVYFIILRKDIFVLSNFGRMGKPFEHPNTLSTYMVIASMLTMYLVFFFEKNIKYVLLLPLAMFIVIGLTTGSRAFIIFAFIILIALSIFRFKKNKWVLLGILAGILILFVLLLTLPMLENLRFRLFNGIATVFGTSTQPDNSVLQRTTWFSYGFTLGGQKFLTGYGVDGFAKASGVLTYSHSNLSEIVCNFGVIGAILFYLPITWLGYLNIKKYTKYSPLVFVFILYCLLASFSNVFYYNKLFYLILAFTIFLAESKNSEGKNQC